MSTVEELVVKAKPEGVDETVDGFEEMQEGLDDAANQMDDTSGSLSDMASEWKGAMGAIVAGLTIATAGLLSKVPVLGSVMGGLEMVIDSLAYKLDQTLRPVLQPLTKEFADLASEIHKSDGILEGLDAIAEKTGSLGLDAIEWSLEGDKLKGLTEDIITFVFPTMQGGKDKNNILDHMFNVNITGVVVLTFLFGGLTITTAKVLSFLLPASISATAIISFVLPTIAVAAVLSHLFGFDMTQTAILGAIFAGVIITGAAVLGAISWPVIAGAAIVGTLFAGVAITTSMVLDALINENAPAAVTGDNRELSTDLETGFVDPSKIPGLKQAYELGQAIGGATGGEIKSDGIMRVHAGETLLPESEFDRNPPNLGGSFEGARQQIRMDGRDVTNQTGRYRMDETARRGRFD